MGASIALFRLDNKAPLSYTCSKLGAVGSTTTPEECGTNRWQSAAVTAGNKFFLAAGSDYTTPYQVANPVVLATTVPLGSSIDGVQWLQTDAQKTAPVSSWNGQEWPAPALLMGRPWSNGRAVSVVAGLVRALSLQ